MDSAGDYDHPDDDELLPAPPEDENHEIPDDWPTYLEPPGVITSKLQIAGVPCVEVNIDLAAMWEGLRAAGVESYKAAHQVHEVRFALTELDAAAKWVNQLFRDRDFQSVRDAESLCAALRDAYLPAVLTSRAVQYMLACELKTSAEITAAANAFGAGLRARKNYRDQKNRGGRPGEVGDRAELQRRFQGARDLLGPLRRFVGNKRNMREAAIARFSELAAELPPSLLDEWLPATGAECTATLEEMAAQYVAAKFYPATNGRRGVRWTTVMRYAYGDVGPEETRPLVSRVQKKPPA